MNASSPAVAVTDHARVRWLQRVDAAGPYPGSSILEAFDEARSIAAGSLDRIHDELGVGFIAGRAGRQVIIITLICVEGDAREAVDSSVDGSTSVRFNGGEPDGSH